MAITSAQIKTFLTTTTTPTIDEHVNEQETEAEQANYSTEMSNDEDDQHEQDVRRERNYNRVAKYNENERKQAESNDENIEGDEGGEVYYAIASYTDSLGDGLNLTKGQQVLVNEFFFSLLNLNFILELIRRRSPINNLMCFLSY